MCGMPSESRRIEAGASEAGDLDAVSRRGRGERAAREHGGQGERECDHNMRVAAIVLLSLDSSSRAGAQR